MNRPVPGKLQPPPQVSQSNDNPKPMGMTQSLKNPFKQPEE